MTGSEEDIAAAADIVYLAWPEVAKSCTEAMIRRDPWRDQQAGFGAFAGSRLVSYARFHYRPVRVGSALLRMAGVADVVTVPEFRRQGLAKRVLSAGVDWMRSSGMTCALLFTGVPYVYSGLGWGEVKEARLSLPMRALPRLGSGRYRIGKVHFTELPAELGRIYELSCGSHPISLARTPAYWRNWPSWMIGNGAFTLSDEWVVAWRGDQLAAYGVAAHSSIAEICSLPGEEEALFDVFDSLAERMRRTRRERQLQLDLPLDHPLAARLAVHGKKEAEVCGMILVLDLPGLLRELGPELAQRWHAAQPGCLRLESPLGAATLTVDRGEVRVDAAPGAPMLRLTPRGLSSLLLGFQSAGDLQQAGEIEGDAQALEVADQLFPWLFSHFWEVDRY